MIHGDLCTTVNSIRCGEKESNTEEDLQGVLADVSIYTGYLTIGLMLGGRFVFQYLGWKIAALATPAIMFITGGAFFGLSLAASMGATGVIFGGVNLATGGALAGAVTQVCDCFKTTSFPAFCIPNTSN